MLKYIKYCFYLKSSFYKMLTGQPKEWKRRKTKLTKHMTKLYISKESLGKKVCKKLFYKKSRNLAYKIKETLLNIKTKNILHLQFFRNRIPMGARIPWKHCWSFQETKISKSGLQHNIRKLRMYYIYTFFLNGPRWVLGLHGNITEPTKKNLRLWSPK